MLIFIGLGLSPKHLTLEALEYLQSVDKIVVDTYTSIVPGIEDLIKEIGRGKEIVYATRSLLEGRGIQKIVEEALTRNIALLVPGDPFIATTHDAIRVEALKRGVKVIVVNGLSIYSLAPSRIGLQAYRFGKTVTLVYPEAFKPYSTVKAIYENLERGLHTLVLLDLRVEENRAMSIPEAVEILLDLDDKKVLKRVIAVGLARLGLSDELIIADLLPNLAEYKYPPPPHSLVIVAKPHPIELDNLRYNCGLPESIYRTYMSVQRYP
ncbi:MAG: diphthine synthase [Thermoprotei archaeon]